MRLPKTVGQTVSILGALVIGTVLMRKLCLPHGDDCILDRSGTDHHGSFWISVIIVKYRGTAYRSYTQKTPRKPCIHQPACSQSYAAFGSFYIQIS
nr:spore germination protein [Bacillus subtilis]